MKVIGHLGRLQHHYVSRQRFGHHARPFLNGHRGGGVKVANLPFGVRAGVRAAGAPQLVFLASDLAYSGCQYAVDGAFSVL